jgi:catalase
MKTEEADAAWEKTVRDAVEVLDLAEGDKTRRPVHTIGIGATGFFTPSDVASNFCDAEIFKVESVPVAVRFSNGSGLAVQHDGWNDVRGMAVKFHLGPDRQVDLLAMTLAEFFTPTIESFLAFGQATVQVPVTRQTLWQQFWDMLHLIRPLPTPPSGQTESAEGPAVTYADMHPESRLAMFHASTLGAPLSYARLAYHAVHTFVISAPDGTQRYVRFNWVPVTGVRAKAPFEAPPEGYLCQELSDRIAEQPVKFLLMMVIGETGDDFADPSRSWPPHRMRVSMGTLTIDQIPEDQENHCEKLSFNPMRLCAGIAPSTDPILRLRLDAYEFSRKRRNAPACPFAKAP